MMNFNNMNKKPCTAVMKKISMLDEKESKKQCYVLMDGAIKFDPAWLTQKDKFMSRTRSRTRALNTSNLMKEVSEIF